MEAARQVSRDNLNALKPRHDKCLSVCMATHYGFLWWTRRILCFCQRQNKNLFETVESWMFSPLAPLTAACSNKKGLFFLWSFAAESRVSIKHVICKCARMWCFLIPYKYLSRSNALGAQRHPFSHLSFSWYIRKMKWKRLRKFEWLSKKKCAWVLGGKHSGVYLRTKSEILIQIDQTETGAEPCPFLLQMVLDGGSQQIPVSHSRQKAPFRSVKRTKNASTRLNDPFCGWRISCHKEIVSNT